MVSALDSGSSGRGSGPGWGHCVVFLGKTLSSHGAFFHPGVNLVPRSPTVIRKGDLVKFDFKHAQCQRGPKYGLFYHCACSYSLL